MEIASKKRALVNSLSSLSTNFLNVVILLYLQQYLLRRISPEEYSIYPVVMSVVLFLRLVQVILNGGVGRYVTSAMARKAEDEVVRIVSSIFAICVVAIMFIFIAAAIGSKYAGPLLGVEPHFYDETRIMFLMLLAMTCVRLVTTPLQSGLRATQRFVWINGVELLATVLRAGLLILFFSALGVRIIWVTLALAMSSAFRDISLAGLSMWKIPEIRIDLKSVCRGTIFELLGFGGWNLVRYLAITIREAADPIILMRLATSLDVACFHLGAIFRKQALELWRIAGVPLAPVAAGLYATGDMQRLRGLYLRGARYAMWISLLVATPLVVFREPIILLYVGEEFMLAATVMLLLCSVIPLEMSNAMLEWTIIASGKVKSYGLIIIGLQAANLGLTLFLVGWLKWGAVGSAAATALITFVGYPLLVMPFVFRILSIRFRAWLIDGFLRGISPALLGAAAWWLLRLLIRPDTWPSVLGSIAVGSMVYLASTAVFMHRADRKDLAHAAERIMVRLRLRSPRRDPEDSSVI